jgi:TRAP-type C4-dicarboxylate transport system permease small subunit
VLGNAAFTFAANALFPRLSWRVRWSARVGLPEALLYVVLRVGAVLAFFRFAAWMARRQEQLRAEARDALGHEPTNDELFDFLRPGTGSSAARRCWRP